jgi:hypothetical protein
MKYFLLLLILVAVGCKSTPSSYRDSSASAPSTQPTESPQARQEHIDLAIERGVAYLIKSQQPDGSWGTGRVTRGFEVYSMVPGSHDAFRIGTSALAVMALREAGQTPEAKEAHSRGVVYLSRYGQARRDDSSLIYNTWAHTYALQALAIEIRHSEGALKEELTAAANWHLDRLCRYETFMGGWNYYDFDAGTASPSMDPTSFGTAAGLVALYEAKQSGLNIPPKLITRAVNRTFECRLPNGAYLYGFDGRYYPRSPHNLPRGSVGRTQSCNYALALWSHPKIGEKQILDGFELFEKEHPYLQMGRQRNLPHDSWYATAPYYYYFGHYYAARLVENLKPPHQSHYAKVVSDGVLQYQEKDGSWWDFPMWDYHQPYGTAFAVMTLRRCK